MFNVIAFKSTRNFWFLLFKIHLIIDFLLLIKRDSGFFLVMIIKCHKTMLCFVYDWDWGAANCKSQLIGILVKSSLVMTLILFKNFILFHIKRRFDFVQNSGWSVMMSLVGSLVKFYWGVGILLMEAAHPAMSILSVSTSFSHGWFYKTEEIFREINNFVTK